MNQVKERIRELRGLMEERDIALLNAYHAQVYEKIAPHLSAEEAEWLKEVTKPVTKN